jgi:hypothetical protein
MGQKQQRPYFLILQSLFWGITGYRLKVINRFRM